MAIIKCKMCGGDLNLVEGVSTAQCEYCGSVQTVPKVDDEKKLTLFGRANRLRAACEFDKAAGIYEAIVADFPEEAEAYWGLLLCKYGIEYVDDPASGKKIPTCHRSSFESILDDSDFEQALENADSAARKVYREEAKTLEEIRKGIVAVSNNEQPYDIFICYKETDEKGDRTLDSVLAQDVYDALTDKGYRVFFSRISLEDKLGMEYEPYIFAALNSAKIMLVFGTDYEYFNAVWVKNEWSRFLKLMAKDKEKHLIPCFKGIDAYDMPKEFAKLQAQDMGKVGAIQDLLRGIEKLSPRHTETVKETVVVQQASATPTAPLLQRAFMFLEDGEWGSANEYCEKVLDIDPECAQAYLGKLMVELRVKKQESLKDQAEPFSENGNFQKAVRFADENLKTILTGYIEHINTRNENARLEGIYEQAKLAMQGDIESAYREAARAFETISHYKDAAVLAKECYKMAEIARKDAIYDAAIVLMKKRIARQEDFLSAIKEFEKIPGWKDTDEQITICTKKAAECKAQEEARRLERERQAELDRQAAAVAAKKRKTRNIALTIASVSLVLVLIFAYSVITESNRNNQYNNGLSLMESGKYEEAIAVFEALDGYKESSDKIAECNAAILENNYNKAVALKDVGKYKEAAIAFGLLKDFKDAKAQAKKLWDSIAVRNAINAGNRHTVALKGDGTVIAVGENYYGQRNVDNWNNIVDISSYDHTVGLKADGTVIAIGDNSRGKCDVSSWRDIVDIAAGNAHTVGLRADGTVVAVGWNDYGQCDVSHWNDIVAISTGNHHTIGLKADGTVVAVGLNSYGQCNVSNWKDIVAIAASGAYTVGLKADGTVVAIGYNDSGRCNVGSWRGIVAIAAGGSHTVGLRADGTIVAVGWNDYGQCDVGGWKNIIAIAAGSDHTVGLKADGTVVAVGSNDHNQCKVSSWKNIKVPEKD